MNNEPIEIHFVKTHVDAILPRRAHPDPLTGDTGYDVFAVEDVTITPRRSVVVPVGLEVAYITPGYWFKVEGRSGLGFKKGVIPHGGIFDNSYRGTCGIKLYNMTDIDVHINTGVAVAQFVIYKLLVADVKFVDKVTETDRGANGFGSTGL